MTIRIYNDIDALAASLFAKISTDYILYYTCAVCTSVKAQTNLMRTVKLKKYSFSLYHIRM